MLIVSVVFEFVPGGFERIKSEIFKAIENSRKEEGAQIYDWALDVTEPNRAIYPSLYGYSGNGTERGQHPRRHQELFGRGL